MFTTVVDDAVARYTLPDGTEIAFAYDDCASNPVTDCDYPIGIERHERDAVMTDPAGVLAEYDSLDGELEELEYTIATMRQDYGDDAVDKALTGDLEDTPFEWWEEQALERIDQVRDELKEITYLEWQDTEEYGGPTYRIAYRERDLITQGWRSVNMVELVLGMAREYSAWANGSVYVMGVEVPGEETEYVGCWPSFDPHDEEQVKDMIVDYVASPDGLQAV